MKFYMYHFNVFRYDCLLPLQHIKLSMVCNKSYSNYIKRQYDYTGLDILYRRATPSEVKVTLVIRFSFMKTNKNTKHTIQIV